MRRWLQMSTNTHQGRGGGASTSCLLWQDQRLRQTRHFNSSSLKKGGGRRGRTTLPSGRLLCVLSLCACLCVRIRMDGNVDVIREVFVCPARSNIGPRKQLLDGRCVMQSSLNYTSLGISRRVRYNVMQERAPTRPLKSLFHPDAHQILFLKSLMRTQMMKIWAFTWSPLTEVCRLKAMIP